MDHTEKKATKFLPAFFLPVVEKGQEFASGELPPHVTLSAPIIMPYESRYGHRMRAELNKYDPFFAKTGEEGWLGGDESTRVRLFEDNLSLMGLYYVLKNTLKDLKRSYEYPQYRPHVSMQTSAEVPKSLYLPITGFSVVEKVQGENWKVVDKVGLKGQR